MVHFARMILIAFGVLLGLMPDADAGALHDALTLQEVSAVFQADADDALEELPPSFCMALEESDDQLRVKRVAFHMHLSQGQRLSALSACLKPLKRSVALHSPPPEFLG